MRYSKPYMVISSPTAYYSTQSQQLLPGGSSYLISSLQYPLPRGPPFLALPTMQQSCDCEPALAAHNPPHSTSLCYCCGCAAAAGGGRRGATERIHMKLIIIKRKQNLKRSTFYKKKLQPTSLGDYQNYLMMSENLPRIVRGGCRSLEVKGRKVNEKGKARQG